MQTLGYDPYPGTGKYKGFSQSYLVVARCDDWRKIPRKTRQLQQIESEDQCSPRSVRRVSESQDH